MLPWLNRIPYWPFCWTFRNREEAWPRLSFGPVLYTAVTEVGTLLLLTPRYATWLHVLCSQHLVLSTMTCHDLGKVPFFGTCPKVSFRFWTTSTCLSILSFALLFDFFLFSCWWMKEHWMMYYLDTMCESIWSFINIYSKMTSLKKSYHWRSCTTGDQVALCNFGFCLPYFVQLL